MSARWQLNTGVCVGVWTCCSVKEAKTHKRTHRHTLFLLQHNIFSLYNINWYKISQREHVQWSHCTVGNSRRWIKQQSWMFSRISTCDLMMMMLACSLQQGFACLLVEFSWAIIVVSFDCMRGSWLLLFFCFSLHDHYSAAWRWWWCWWWWGGSAARKWINMFDLHAYELCVCGMAVMMGPCGMMNKIMFDRTI